VLEDKGLVGAGDDEVADEFCGGFDALGSGKEFHGDVELFRVSVEEGVGDVALLVDGEEGCF